MSLDNIFLALVCAEGKGEGGMRRNTRKKRHRGEPGRTRDTVPVGILPRSGLRRNHLGGGRVEAPRGDQVVVVLALRRARTCVRLAYNTNGV